MEKLNFLELIGIKEAYQASYELEKLMFDEERRTDLFKRFIEKRQDLSFDWFTEFFQEEQADRKGKKQDFTPDSVVQIASRLLGSTKLNVDICAGTGGLTIKQWNENKNAQFYCEEFSDRAIPFLLFNLAIRNMDAVVRHGDSLSRECFAIYKITPGEKFSSIERVDDGELFNADTVIMNPPYSLTWEAKPEWIEQPRFNQFDKLAPKSKADYAFLLEGLSRLNEQGKMAIILPHGVLFRGQAESIIRQKLIELNLLEAVIGLPEKLFYATDIPTCILVINKQKTTKDILFVDASNEYKKGKKHNELEQNNVDKIISTYEKWKSIEKYSEVVRVDQIEENDFNLNIPRYVDTFEPEPEVDIREVLKDLDDIEKEEHRLNVEISKQMDELIATNSMKKSYELDAMKAFWRKRAGRKQEPIDPQMELL